MSSAITPRRLQKRVDEWRESRMKKLAARLQIHADKSRTVSASVLGISEDKPVHLPTPPSAKSTEFKGRPSTGGQLKKSFSYGDVHDYPGQQRHANQHYQHDYRAGGVNRPEPRSPYQSYHHGHHPPPRSPHHYNPHDYRGSNAPRSEPRKSFSSSGGGYRTSYAPGGYKGQHQHPSTSNYNYNNKGIRKHTGQSHGQNSVSSPASHASTSHVKGSDSRKSLAPKEKTVTFEDEKKEEKASTKEALKSEPGPVNSVETIPTPEIESQMNSTFTLDDGQETTSDVCNSDNSTPTAQPEINSLQNVSDENVHSTGTANVPEINNPQCDADTAIVEEKVTENQHDAKLSSSEHVEIPKIIISSPLPQEGGNILEEDIDRSCEPVVVENTTYLPEVEVCEVVEVEVSENGEVVEVEVTENCEVEKAEPAVEETEVDEPSFSLCLDADTILEEVVDATTDEVMTEIQEEDKDIDASEVYYPADEQQAVTSILEEVKPDVAVQSVEVDTGGCSEEAPSHSEQPSKVVESCEVSESKVHPAEPERVEKENEQSFHDENCVPAQDTSMNDVELDQQKRLGPSTPEPPKITIAQKELGHGSPKKNVEEIIENLDSLYITPGRSARKSRALVDSTNIVESSSIKYVVRDKKNKDAVDVVLTPVRRSTRKKAETPGASKNVQELSPEKLRKAKIVPNPFLKS